MPNTEQNYLLLHDERKARTWMLLRSEQQFHLVRVDASLTAQKYERLMKRYPCGMKTFQELGISATPLNREKCTHVILEGSEAGVRLTILCAGNTHRYILGDAYSEEWLEAFFDGQQVQWRVTPVPEEPDAQTTKIIGWTMNIAAFVLLLLASFADGLLGTCTAALNLLLFGAAVVLCVIWPGRFTIGGMKNEDRRGEAKYRTDMDLALGMPPLAMGVNCFWVAYPDILMLFLWGAVLGLAIGVLLTWASRKYRSSIAGAIGLTLCLMLFSCGIVAQLNQLLDFGPTTAYCLTVDSTEVRTGGRGRTGYECHITMPDGRQLEFDIPWSRYEELSSGDPITVIAHDGALGFEYMTIDWDE